MNTVTRDAAVAVDSSRDDTKARDESYRAKATAVGEPVTPEGLAKRKVAREGKGESKSIALDVANAILKRPPNLDFVIPGLLTGAVGGLVAPGGTGKGHVTIGLGFSKALGIPLCGGALPAPARSGRVLFLQGEDPAPVLAHRIHSWARHLLRRPEVAAQFRSIDDLAKFAAERIAILPLKSQANFLLDDKGRWSPLLKRIAKRAARYQLIVLDPFRRFVNGSENDAGLMTNLVAQLEWIASATGTSFLIVHHTNKASVANGAGQLSQAIRGSSAITDALRLQINLSGMTEGQAKLLGVYPGNIGKYVQFGVAKSNHAIAPPPVWLQRLDDGILEKVVLGAKLGSGQSDDDFGLTEARDD